MTKVKDMIAKLNERFPENIASSGDPVGLQIGSVDAEITKITTTLDVRPNVVDEAIKKGVDLIISHHPVMLRPTRNLDFSDPQNTMYGRIIAHGIAAYSIHTNSDKAKNDSNDWQAKKLGLTNTESFAIDDDGIAVGRKGKLPKPTKATDFAYYTKKQMNADFVRLITVNNNKIVSTVGSVCGDGGKFWRDALKDNLDAYITGDVYYHVGHNMISSDLTVVDPGHYTESLFKTKCAEVLGDLKASENWSVEIVISQESTDPFQDLM